MMRVSNIPILSIKDLSFSITGRKILENLSCSFASGRIHALIGPNGSGKSTFLRNICRIWEPQGGTVLVDGRDLRKISRRDLSKLITLVPQDSHIDFSIRVFDFIAMGRHPHLKRLQRLGRADLNCINQALEVTRTASFRDRPINELSGGEAQLVSIARALATEAPIILLDEPTSALDIRHKLEIMELLVNMRNEGKTILISMHDLDLARRHCDTVTMLKDGRIVFHGAADQGFARDKIKEVFDVYVEEHVTGRGVSLVFYK